MTVKTLLQSRGNVDSQYIVYAHKHTLLRQNILENKVCTVCFKGNSSCLTLWLVSMVSVHTVILMMRWPAWHLPQGIVALALLIESQLRTGRPHHEDRRNSGGRARKMTGILDVSYQWSRVGSMERNDLTCSHSLSVKIEKPS